MPIILHWKTLESPLIQMPAATRSVMLVVTANVRHANPSHESAQHRRGVRPEDKVPMIAHQAIGQKINRVSLQPLGEHLDERVEVPRLVKELHAAIAASSARDRSYRLNSTGHAWHEKNVPAATSYRQ